MTVEQKILELGFKQTGPKRYVRLQDGLVLEVHLVARKRRYRFSRPRFRNSYLLNHREFMRLNLDTIQHMEFFPIAELMVKRIPSMFAL